MKSPETVTHFRPSSVIRTAADFSRWIDTELKSLESKWNHLAAPCALRTGRNIVRCPKPR